MLRCLPAALLVLLLLGGSLAGDEIQVEPGDTLSALARRHGTTVAAIRERNGLPDDFIRAGQVLIMPGEEAPRGFQLVLAAPGDTLEGIAAGAGLPLATLQSANPEIATGTDLGGLPVLIPPAAGLTIWASGGDTLVGLAARFGVAPSLLASVNDLADGGPLEAGRPLLVPAGAHSSGPASTVAGGEPPALGGTDQRDRHRSAQVMMLARASTLLRDLERIDEVFLYPVRGRLTSAFGWRNISVGGNRFHGGIDIAADAGTPILAARQGVVTKAGWGGAYGYVVYLDHGDGSQTRYAHLSSIGVALGQTVRQHDPLGLAGSTGASTGPHLHFELRLAGRAVDPLPYLESVTP